MLTKSILNEIMADLAKDDFIFSNERDFQFVMAKKLEAKGYICHLEYPSFNKATTYSSFSDLKSAIISGGTSFKLPKAQREYTDIVVEDTEDRTFCTLELKYKTPEKVCLYKSVKMGTTFGKCDVITLAQGANNIGSYNYWHDVSRLERINSRLLSDGITINRSFALLLSNCDKYWESDLKGTTEIWTNYNLKDGTKRGPGTLFFKKSYLFYKEFKALDLTNPYYINWLDYEAPSSLKGLTYSPAFKYLILEVHTNSVRSED